ncbi:hypothetical protein D3C86_1593710 [compost metagenome]
MREVGRDGAVAAQLLRRQQVVDRGHQPMKVDLDRVRRLDLEALDRLGRELGFRGGWQGQMPHDLVVELERADGLVSVVVARPAHLGQ